MESYLMVTRLPFAGFYNSLWSGECDNAEQQEIENFTSDKQDDVPKEFQLDSNEYAEILMRHTDYRAMYQSVAKAYIDAFDTWAAESIGKLHKTLGMTFESMDSPREYNFTTDRVYANIPSRTVRLFFAISKRDGHEKLEMRIKESFTSYDGFLSHYSNNIATWLEKSVLEWDHNELCTLIEAVTGFYEGDRGETGDWKLYYAVTDGGLYEEYDNAVDWPAVEKDIAERRAEMEDELRAADPGYIPPPQRCPDTPDLFA